MQRELYKDLFVTVLDCYTSYDNVEGPSSVKTVVREGDLENVSDRGLGHFIHHHFGALLAAGAALVATHVL